MNETQCELPPPAATDLCQSQNPAVPSIAPGHLQAIAHLHGLATAPLATARILELHGPNGTALITYAFAHSSARIVSVANPDGQRVEGASMLDQVRPSNLERRTAALNEIGQDLGLFDYILCSCSFDQATPETQRHILRICAENLEPHGIACIGHNTPLQAVEHLRPQLADHQLDYVAHTPARKAPPHAYPTAVSDALPPETGGTVNQLVGTPTNITLLHRDSPLHQPRAKISSSALAEMHFGMWVSLKNPTTDAPSANEHYTSSTGGLLVSDGPVTTQVIEALRQVWPAPVRFPQLVARIRKYMPRRGGESLASSIKRSLRFLMESGMLKFHLEPPGYVELSRNANKPRLLPALAHALAANEWRAISVGVPNLWHDMATLPTDPVTLTIAPHLNGTTTIPQLRSLVRVALSNGDIPLPRGFPTTGRYNLNGLALQLLMPALQSLRQRGLLL